MRGRRLGAIALAGVLAGCGGFDAPGGGAGSSLPTISRGERVDLEDHLEKGKYTLFAFGADW